jgi:hypothetical protein
MYVGLGPKADIGGSNFITVTMIYGPISVRHPYETGMMTPNAAIRMSEREGEERNDTAQRFRLLGGDP